MIGETKNKYIINNYYYVTLEDLQKVMQSKKPNSFCPFFPGQIDGLGSIQTNPNNVFLNKKRENPNIKINNYLPNNIQILINEKDNKEEKEIEGENSRFQTTISDDSKNINTEPEQDDENKIKFKVKKQIFNINIKNKIGRKPKASVIKGYHTKYSHDNILRKIKVKFLKRVINYINSIIMSKNIDGISILKPLKGEIAQNNTIQYNIELMNSKLRNILSSNEINGKFKLFDKYYNKNVIDTIYNENIKELIDIFEMTFFDVFKIFRDKNETEKLNGFEKIDSVIREIKLKEKDEEYINKLEKVAMNYENYYSENLSRKRDK